MTSPRPTTLASDRHRLQSFEDYGAVNLSTEACGEALAEYKRQNKHWYDTFKTVGGEKVEYGSPSAFEFQPYISSCTVSADGAALRFCPHAHVCHHSKDFSLIETDPGAEYLGIVRDSILKCEDYGVRYHVDMAVQTACCVLSLLRSLPGGQVIATEGDDVERGDANHHTSCARG